MDRFAKRSFFKPIAQFVTKPFKIILGITLVLGMIPSLAFAETQTDATAAQQGIEITDTQTSEIEAKETTPENTTSEETSPEATTGANGQVDDIASQTGITAQTVVTKQATAATQANTVANTSYDHSQTSTETSPGLTVYWNEPVAGQPTTFHLEGFGATEPYKYRLDAAYSINGNGYDWIIDTSNNAYSTTQDYSYTFTNSGKYQFDFSVFAKVGTQFDTGSVRITLNLTFSGTKTVDEIAQEVVDECISKVGNSKYEKALWLHDWLIDHMEYSDNYSGAVGALLHGEGTCEAYRSAYELLLKKAGIVSARMTGNGHTWNAVEIDGNWCQVDPTWDDVNYGDLDVQRHLYFGLTDELMKMAHDKHEPQAGYISNTLTNNYLVRSGKVKTWADSYVSDIDSNIKSGKASFAIADKNPTWDAALKKIGNSLIAYDLGNRSWTKADGSDAGKLKVTYDNGQFTVTTSASADYDGKFVAGLSKTSAGTRFGKTDGTYAKNQWITTGGKKYYFGSDGYACVGRHKIGYDHYCFWSDGSMITSRWWNNRYYGSDGREAKPGWLVLGANTYLIKDDGTFTIGRIERYSNHFCFWSNGSRINGRWWNNRYYGSDGKEIKQGWFDHNGNRYYITSDGTFATGRHKIGYNHYRFWSNGGMLYSRWYEDRYYETNGKEAKSKWLTFGTIKMYIKDDGYKAVGRLIINSSYYRFWSNGNLVVSRWLNGHYYNSVGVEII